MQPPPFRASAIVASLARECDAACDRAPSADAETRTTRGRRLRLADLDHHLHCSVISTCLGTAELHRLVPRHAEVDRERATDPQIHHAAVELAIRGGSGARALERLLDERHALAVRCRAAPRRPAPAAPSDVAGTAEGTPRRGKVEAAPRHRVAASAAMLVL